MRWLVRQYRGIRIWLVLHFGGSLNVKWLGAHGNYPEDDHDDTEAFQRTVNLLARKGGKVSADAGTYGVKTITLR